MLFAGRPRAAFSSPRSQFFTIRTDPKPVNNILFFSCGKMAYKWVCLRKFVIELAYVPPVYRSIRKKSNERVTQILDKERGINEQIYFELLYVYSCI